MTLRVCDRKKPLLTRYQSEVSVLRIRNSMFGSAFYPISIVAFDLFFYDEIMLGEKNLSEKP